MRDDRLRDDPVVRQVLLARPPLSEEDLAPTGERAKAIIERVLATDVPAERVRRVGSPRALFAMAVPLLGVAALVLLIAGVFSGPGGSGTQPALATVIRRVEQATSTKPGTIVISIVRGAAHGPSGGPSTVAPPTVVYENVWETPAASGPQSYVTSGFAATDGTPNAIGSVAGDDEIYLKRTNTIYISSIWGPYISKGKTPGTFIYKRPPYPGATYLQTEVAGNLPAGSVKLTTAQRRALLDGSEEILDVPIHPATSDALRPRLIRATNQPGLVQDFRSQLRSRQLRIVGLRTVDGRPALELASRHVLEVYGKSNRHVRIVQGIKIWVNPKTYAPVKEVSYTGKSVTGDSTWLEYKTLPITPANNRLVSLTALYPHARVDRKYEDYIKADNGFTIPQS